MSAIKFKQGTSERVVINSNRGEAVFLDVWLKDGTTRPCLFKGFMPLSLCASQVTQTEFFLKIDAIAVSETIGFAHALWVKIKPGEFVLGWHVPTSANSLLSAAWVLCDASGFPIVKSHSPLANPTRSLSFR